MKRTKQINYLENRAAIDERNAENHKSEFGEDDHYEALKISASVQREMAEKLKAKINRTTA